MTASDIDFKLKVSEKKLIGAFMIGIAASLIANILSSNV